MRQDKYASHHNIPINIGTVSMVVQMFAASTTERWYNISEL